MTDLPCGPGADARYCETLWAQNAELESLRAQLTEAKRERAHLVAHLAAVYPSCIGPAHDVDEDGWAIVYIRTSQGQLTWHIAPRDLDLFGHLRIGAEEWDGHTTAEKYKRLDAQTRCWRHGPVTWDDDLRRERDQARAVVAELRDVLLQGGQDAGDVRRQALGVIERGGYATWPVAPVGGACSECKDGLVPIGRCNCGSPADASVNYAHERLCGFEPCPNGCWERLHPAAGAGTEGAGA